MPTLHLADLAHCGGGSLIALWALTLIAAATCGLLIYSIASFRNTPGPGSASFARRTVIEILWAMIPILILVSTATPSVSALMTAADNCTHSGPSIMH